MADQKISELTNITGANLANADEFVVVDVSADQTKAVTREQFFLSVPAITVDGDVIIGDDLFVSGPNPVINIVETGVNQHRILGTGGSLYIQAQDSDGTTDGDMHLTGYVGADLNLLNIKAANTTISGNVTTTGAITVSRTAGYGSVEVGGPSGGLIDLKSPASDDYDARIIYNGVNLQINTLAAGEPILLRQGNSTKLETSSTGVTVTGNLTATGDVTIGDDLFMTGPSPNIFMNDSDGTNQQTQIIQSGGNTYFRARNEASDGSFIFQGYGGGSATEFVKIVSNGRVGINEANPSQALEVNGAIVAQTGIYLGGEATANKLDDYEEGTWTPAISDGTNVGTTNIAVGSYTKTGNHVHVQGRVRLSSLGSVSGSIRITGLPFSSNAVSSNFSAMTIGRAAGLNLTAGTTVCGDLRVNVTSVFLQVWDVGAGVTTMQGTEFSANGDISFSMDYLSN